MKKSLSSAAIKVWKNFYNLMYGICYFLLGIFIGLSWFFQWPRTTVFLLGGLIVLLAVYHLAEFLWLIPARYKYFSYQATDRFIKVSEGRVFKNTLTVPLTKIYFVNIKSDPFVEKYQLRNVEFGTLGDQHRIPCLEIAEAEALKEHIIHYSNAENTMEETLADVFEK